MNICADDKYTAYYYDDYNEVCYCYEGNEATYQEVITGNIIKKG